MDQKNSDAIELSDREVAEKAIEIIKILNGLPIGLSFHILSQAQYWIRITHIVDTSAPYFKSVQERVLPGNP